jgi:L-alanine-DL-glutamate epimerase-like enolase superfamily enzyme
MKLSVHLEAWSLKQPFRITGKEFRTSEALVVHLSDGNHVGRGEGQGVFYLDETVTGMQKQVESIAEALRQGLSREELQELLPAGGARNAVDCALWDLEAKQTGKTIWQLTGINPKPVTTVFTIGLQDTPEAMAAQAAAAADYPVLKIKLNADRPVERLSAIREARPDAKLVVDANQGWSFDQLAEILPRCVELKLDMIEQPLARGDDAVLAGFDSPIVLAADESCLHTGELATAVERYDMINIKLDKTGGLTEALRLARAARAQGCQLMVGNMMGTSLAMAPSFVVAQLCDFVDIDGPLLLKYDRMGGLRYQSGQVEVFSPAFWG